MHYIQKITIMLSFTPVVPSEEINKTAKDCAAISGDLTTILVIACQSFICCLKAAGEKKKQRKMGRGWHLVLCQCMTVLPEKSVSDVMLFGKTP